MIVQSFGALQSLAPDTGTNWWWPASDSVSLYGTGRTYAALYAAQPNIRTCVDFLARNIAMLGLHLFRRVSDIDRTRITEHPLLDWLEHPNPYTTRYRLIESLIGDLGIYFNAYWIKVRVADDTLRLVRLPPDQMCVEGGLLPRVFKWTTYDGQVREFAPTEIVYFNGYNPLNPLAGLSPMVTLRQILAEEEAAGAHREKYWLNASRMEGVIERSKDAPNWTDVQQQTFREQWQEFTGNGPKAGMIPVLPRGMTMKTLSFSARDSEYLSARKLSREECAAAYHIPLPMVGILEHATFSNIKEQHKQLYADCLGPWLEMVQQEIENQLLPEASNATNLYVEFNIADKLKGSFEEQSTALKTAVGRPFMTPNEARGRLNLPSIKDDPTADQLASLPGAADPSSATDNPEDAPPADQPPPPAGQPETPDAVAEVLLAARNRQHTRLQKLPPVDRATHFCAQLDRWNAELTEDLTPLVGAARAAHLAWTTNIGTLLALDSTEGQIQ